MGHIIKLWIRTSSCLQHCTDCIDILWVCLSHMQTTKMVLHSTYQTYTGKDPQFKGVRQILNNGIYLASIFNVWICLTKMNLVVTYVLLTLPIHFCYWNVWLHAAALEDPFFSMDSYTILLPFISLNNPGNL